MAYNVARTQAGPAKMHPVNHAKGPVRTSDNTRNLHANHTAKNTVDNDTRRGVRSPANSIVSGKSSPTKATNTQDAPTVRGIRSAPNNARSL